MNMPFRPKKIGILLMAHGGPNHINDMAGYLANIRQGRATSQRIVKELQNQYQQIGGASPLLQRSQEQQQALQAKLNSEQFHCYLGMRYWPPYIEETIAQMIDDGIEEAISLVLAPQYSKLSVAKYQQQIAEGLKLFRGKIQFTHIDSFYDHEIFLRAMQQQLEQGFKLWDADSREQIHVLFTAHSLPERLQKMGDRYPSEVQETAKLIAQLQKLSNAQWSFCYQSAGKSPEPWLGPSVETTLSTLQAQGIKNVMLFPVGFVSDHSETLYDLDIAAKQFATKIGITVKRPSALNDSALFIDALADLIISSKKISNDGMTRQCV